MNYEIILFEEGTETGNEGGHTSGNIDEIEYTACYWTPTLQLVCNTTNSVGDIGYNNAIGAGAAQNFQSYTDVPADLNDTVGTSFEIINKMYALPMEFNGVQFNVWLLLIYVFLLIAVIKLFTWLGHGG